MHTEGRLIDGRTDSEGDDLPADTQDAARELQFVEGREEAQDDLLLLVLALVFASVLLQPSFLDLKALQCVGSRDALVAEIRVELLELIDVV